MRTDRRTYTIGTTPATVDLSLMTTEDVNSGHYLNSIADFCLEMEGNNAEATLKGKGTFSNSTFKSITDGSFASGGGMVSLTGFSLSAFEVTTTATLPIYLNVTRQIRNI